MRALSYIRPATADYFRSIGARLFGADALFTSDFPGLAQFDLSPVFYRALHARTPVPAELQLFRPDITARCRLLRSLPVERANRLFDAMAVAVTEILGSATPDLVISITVDSYVVDLLRQAAELRGIPFFGISSFILNGYFLVTARGERNDFRTPDEGESESAVATLSEVGYRATYVSTDAGSPGRVLRRWSREVIKLGYFPAIGAIRRDSWNYHYRASQQVARARADPRCLSAWAFEQRDWQIALASLPAPVVFHPMQYHPECNTDYWPRRGFENYESDLIDVLRFLDGRFAVLVKEHPLMFGSRPVRVYRELGRIPGVMIVPHNVRSRFLFDYCQVVLSWSGSVGIEAAANGLGVVTLGSPYYASGEPFEDIATRVQLSDISDAILRRSRARSTPEISREAMRRILANTIPGVIWSDAWSPQPRTASEMEATACSLERYLPEWLAWRKNSDPPRHGLRLPGRDS